MRIHVPTHPGVLLDDPQIIVASTLDLPQDRLFRPSIIISDGGLLHIHHTLPAQPYVHDTWTDQDVMDAVAAHLLTLEVQ